MPTIQEVPPFLRGAVRGALVQALRGLQAAQGYDREKQVTRAWALFLLAPRMLLARVPEHGRAGRRVLLDKAQAFQRGEWTTTLLRQARDGRRGPQVRGPVDASRRRETACAKVRNGEVSRARHVLTSADLAPGDDTLALARLTALRKPGGGVRGIATGDCFRRLVARALAKQWAPDFDAATRPFQYALQARSGTDALATQLRVALERAPDAVVVSLDGRAAYDTMSRESFLTALQDAAPSLLPFVRLFYGRTCIYYWWDDTGRRREVRQGEGCEQGDPLAPALYAIGQHAALLAAQSRLQADEEVFAFLDDLYVLTTLPRARVARDVVAGAVEAGCGIASNHGKTRIFGWSNAPAPPEVADLGPDVWRGNKPPHQRGFVVLGAPIGHPAFIQAWADERLQEERRLLHELPELPDLQCAWLLLALCVSPRANHALRTLPPSEVAGYAAAHDAALWDTFLSCIPKPSKIDFFQSRLIFSSAD